MINSILKRYLLSIAFLWKTFSRSNLTTTKHFHLGRSSSHFTPNSKTLTAAFSEFGASMMTMNLRYDDKSEIVFFDVETTVPTRPGQARALLEFGAILVCPRTLAELESYVTLIRPADLSRIHSLSDRGNGISRDTVLRAPSFRQVADRVYDMLHGRVWAGHDILRHDRVRIKEAFYEIGREAPDPRGTIDSLPILTQKFGKRAGDMKMASLAAYFGLGKQTHRSLDDARMNLEVVRRCAAVLFLESSLPDIFPPNDWASLSASTRSHSNGKGIASVTIPSSSHKRENNPVPIYLEEKRGEDHSWSSSAVRNRKEQVLNQAEPSADQHNAFDRGSLRSEVRAENLQPDVNMDEKGLLRKYCGLDLWRIAVTVLIFWTLMKCPFLCSEFSRLLEESKIKNHA